MKIENMSKISWIKCISVGIPKWNLTEDGACARTVLAFIVRSICINYKGCLSGASQKTRY